MMTPESIQAQLIINLRRENAALKRAVSRLEKDKVELQKFLVITLQDNLGDRPAVVSRERYAEARGEFELEENEDGGLLIKARRVV